MAATDITKYLESIEKRIDAIDTCEALEEASTAIKEELAQLLVNIQEQIDILAALVEPPTDLPTVIDWITALINNFVAPYEKSMLELVRVTEKITAILLKLSNRIGTLGCSFEPPTIP